MKAIDVLDAICTAVDKGDEPELILAEDSPLMEASREILKPRAPYEPPMLSRMDDLVDERNYLRNKVVALEESIERTFDDIAVLREAVRWRLCSEELPKKKDFDDFTEIRVAWKMSSGNIATSTATAAGIRLAPLHYHAWQPMPPPYSLATENKNAETTRKD